MVVLSDTHRFDYAPPYVATSGSSVDLRPAPNVELLARDGVSFLQAFTPVPISAPAYATLLTGEQPARHGLLNNHQHLGPSLPLLPERLGAAGYATAAVVANPFCSAAHGFGRGFDHYWDAIEGRGKEGEHVTAAAIEWLESRPRERPFFLFAAYMDAHTPFMSDAVPPSLLVEVNGEPCCVLRAENAHLENRIPLRLEPGRHRVTLTYLEELKPAQPADGVSPLYFSGLSTGDGELVARFGSGFRDVAERPEFRGMDNRAVVNVENTGTAPLEGELRFRCHRLYDQDEYRRFYLEGARSFDRHFGRLIGYLKRNDLYESTLIVFVSDHGEMLGEQEALGHVNDLYEQTLRVPLIVKAPGLEAGSSYRGRFELRQLGGLISSLAMGEEPAQLPQIQPRDLVATTFPPEAEELLVSVRRGHLKLISDGGDRRELFDLENDPGETSNLYQELAKDPRVVEMMDTVHAELRQIATLESLDLGSLAPEQLQELRALGYID